MCLGSLLLPRIMAAGWHPLRVYAGLELGIGVIGLALLFGMPLVGGAYTAWAGGGVSGILLRGVAASVCLLPPTLLMGATLPAIARWVEATPQGVAWLGFFYGGNIAGAVVGSLLAGFYLLRRARHGRRDLRGRGVECRHRPHRAGGRDEGAVSAGRAGRPRQWRPCAIVGSSTSSIALVRDDGAGGRSAVDAHAVAAVRCHDLYVLADPGGLSRRPRHRQQRRLDARAAPRPPAHGARLVPAAAVRGRWPGPHTC